MDIWQNIAKVRKCGNYGSEEHETDKCENDTTYSNCCLRNRFKTDFSTKHGMRDKTCNAFDVQIANLRSRIDCGPTD